MRKDELPIKKTIGRDVGIYSNKTLKKHYEDLIKYGYIKEVSFRREESTEPDIYIIFLTDEPFIDYTLALEMRVAWRSYTVALYGLLWERGVGSSLDADELAKELDIKNVEIIRACLVMLRGYGRNDGMPLITGTTTLESISGKYPGIKHYNQ